MGRWEPDARGRLEQAAMDLFRERGFEGTTVADIAERAGLTERTFFRHFADKREVLFGGAAALQQLLVDQVERAPEELAPLEVVLAALVEVDRVVFEGRRDFAQRRQAVIAANAELREREQVKLAGLASELADALARRGVAVLAANLAAEAGMAIFKIAFQQWIADADGPSLSESIRECADELTTVATARDSASPLSSG